MTTLIEAQNIKKSYGSIQALQSVDLRIDQSKITTLLGPNGSGKTTLLRIFAGLEKPTHGKIMYNGTAITDSNRHTLRQKATMVFQKTFFFNTTVYNNISYGLKLRKYSKNDIEKKWWLVNAEGKILGRLATEVSILMRGKRKAQFANFLDCGDFVVVINAEKVRVTGKKEEQKKYYSHSGYPGGLKEKTFKELMNKKPEEIIRRAVWGMMPKNKLGRSSFKKLKVYRGPNHPHEAQKPQEYQF